MTLDFFSFLPALWATFPVDCEFQITGRDFIRRDSGKPRWQVCTGLETPPKSWFKRKPYLHKTWKMLDVD